MNLYNNNFYHCLEVGVRVQVAEPLILIHYLPSVLPWLYLFLSFSIVVKMYIND